MAGCFLPPPMRSTIAEEIVLYSANSDGQKKEQQTPLGRRAREKVAEVAKAAAKKTASAKARASETASSALRRALEALLNALEKIAACAAKLAKVKAAVYMLKYEDEMVTLAKLKTAALERLVQIQEVQDARLEELEHWQLEQQQQQQQRRRQQGEEGGEEGGEEEDKERVATQQPPPGPELLAPAEMELLGIVLEAMEQQPLQEAVRAAVCEDIRRFVDKQRRRQQRSTAALRKRPAQKRCGSSGGNGGGAPGGVAFGSSESGASAANRRRQQQEEQQQQPLVGFDLLDSGGGGSTTKKGIDMAKAPSRDLQAFVSLPNRGGLAMKSDFGARRSREARVQKRATKHTYQPSEECLSSLRLG